MLLVLAALPALFWDHPPDTAASLQEAGIHQVVVPTSLLGAWKSVSDIAAESADLQDAAKLLTPVVNYRINQASATRAPWIVSNGWKIVRRPDGRYYYDAPGSRAAVAAAEAYCFGARAWIKTDPTGLKPLADMLDFLRALPDRDLPPVADIGFVDDGSAVSGEVINLFVRDNLMFRLVDAPDPNLKVNVKIGTPDYPEREARDPSAVVHQVRYNLTDEKRSVRIYGSAVVVARLAASGDRARLHLLNYAGAERKVQGIRVRVLGRYSKFQVAANGEPAELQDFTVLDDATEFTLPELKTYAVVDLSR